MEGMPHSPRTDGTLDFFGTLLQTLQVEELGETMISSPDGFERLGALVSLDELAANGISREVRRSAQEKIDSLEF